MLLLGSFGCIAAFITTVKAARCFKFSMKLAAESDFLSYGGGWAGSEADLRPLLSRFCICIEAEPLPLLFYCGAIVLYCCPLVVYELAFVC